MFPEILRETFSFRRAQGEEKYRVRRGDGLRGGVCGAGTLCAGDRPGRRGELYLVY